ncbi:MAG: TIM barrel protein [Ignavibacteriales bacterium]
MSSLSFGLSFGSLIKDKKHFDQVLECKPEIIEIPYLEHNDLQSIIELCKKNCIKSALHYPSYYSLELTPFSITEPDSLCTKKNLELIQSTLTDFHNLEYLVLHFPSKINTFKDYNRIKNDTSIILDTISKIQNKFGTKIIIENVYLDKAYSFPNNYLDYFKNSKDAFMCLDIGHAHTLDNSSIEDFLENLGARIFSAHFYNTPRNKTSEFIPGNHYPLSDYGNYTDGDWINLKEISKKMRLLPNLKYVILEVDRNSLNPEDSIVKQYTMMKNYFNC